MKVYCCITDQEFENLEKYIDCEFTNPSDQEFIFHNPSNEFLLMLGLFSIEYYQQQ
jgi:hypothetical protein